MRLALGLAGGVAVTAMLVLSGGNDRISDTRPASAPLAPVETAEPSVERSAIDRVSSEVLPLLDEAGTDATAGAHVSASAARAALQAILAGRSGGGSADPAVLVGEVLDRMNDAQVRSALSQLLGLQTRDLEGIRDLRDYAQRLAVLAGRGVIDAQPSGGPAAESVQFSNGVDAMGAPTETAGRFDGAAKDRIYALFPTEDYASDKVLVKWYRATEPVSIADELQGPPRLLLFGRYAVHPGEKVSHVWLSQDGSWTPGDYAVEIYDPAEPLVKLAEGRFIVAAESAQGK